MSQSTNNLLCITNLVQSIKKEFEEFSKRLSKISENFNQEISHERFQAEQELQSICQYITNILSKQSKEYLDFSRRLLSEVLDPFQLFMDNHKQTNKTTIQSIKQLIQEQQKARQEHLKKEEEYIKACKVSEKINLKIEKMMQQVDKKEKSQEDLNKITKQAINPKLEVEEHLNQYKQSIQVTNHKWEDFAKNLDQRFKEYDTCDEHRIIFTRNTLVNLIRGFSEFYSIQTTQVRSYEDKIRELDE